MSRVVNCFFKRLIACIFIVGILLSQSFSSSAHRLDVFNGNYCCQGRPANNMTLVVNPTALFGSHFTSSFFISNYNAWNGISSNAKITGYFIRTSNSVPLMIDAINVNGGIPSNNARGEAKYYNCSGTEVSSGSTVHRASITLNTNISFTSTTAKRTFLHELGHIFKLSHPTQSSTFHVGNDANNSNGFPFSIMNPHDINTPAMVSNTIVTHDISCFAHKWG